MLDVLDVLFDVVLELVEAEIMKSCSAAVSSLLAHLHLLALDLRPLFPIKET